MGKKNEEQMLDTGSGFEVLANHPDRGWEVRRSTDGMLTVFAPEESNPESGLTTMKAISRPKPENEVRERLTPNDGWVWV